MTSLWALRALLYLADQRSEALASAYDIARAVGAPASSMAKVLNRLCSAGLVVSQRGAGGGFMLTQPPEAISIGLVLRLLDDPIAATLAPEGSVAFSDLTALLAGLQRQALATLESLPIADLSAAPRPGRHQRSRAARRL